MKLEQAVKERLQQVIDPETGVDVMRMRLIEDLQVDADSGRVCYKFRPSSPLCPVAVPLALGIRDAVDAVPGVTGQEIEVLGYVGSEELDVLLRERVSRG